MRRTARKIGAFPKRRSAYKMPAMLSPADSIKTVPAVTRDRFDAVLFDLDGVLTSTAAIHAAAWKRMFDRYLQDYARTAPGSATEAQRLRPFDADADYKKYVDGKPRYEGVRSFLESRGIRLPPGRPNEPPNDQ